MGLATVIIEGVESRNKNVTKCFQSIGYYYLGLP